MNITKWKCELYRSLQSDWVDVVCVSVSAVFFFQSMCSRCLMLHLRLVYVAVIMCRSVHFKAGHFSNTDSAKWGWKTTFLAQYTYVKQAGGMAWSWAFHVTHTQEDKLCCPKIRYPRILWLMVIFCIHSHLNHLRDWDEGIPIFRPKRIQTESSSNFELVRCNRHWWLKEVQEMLSAASAGLWPVHFERI